MCAAVRGSEAVGGRRRRRKPQLCNKCRVVFQLSHARHRRALGELLSRAPTSAHRGPPRSLGFSVSRHFSIFRFQLSRGLLPARNRRAQVEQQSVVTLSTRGASGVGAIGAASSALRRRRGGGIGGACRRRCARRFTRHIEGCDQQWDQCLHWLRPSRRGQRRARRPALSRPLRTRMISSLASRSRSTAAMASPSPQRQQRRLCSWRSS